MSVERLLGRIRAALGRTESAAVEPPPEVDDELVRLAGPQDDLPGLFAARAQEAGMRVLCCGVAEAADRLRELIGDRRAAGETSLLPELENRTLPELYDGVEVGVTEVDFALAESGTLILHTGPGRGRGLSLVPPVHVAIVGEDRVLPDMLDYWARVRGTAPPSSRVFITGPSKTADIEGELVQGVHGPREVLILLHPVRHGFSASS